jgi:hypothetical protein
MTATQTIPESMGLPAAASFVIAPGETCGVLTFGEEEVEDDDSVIVALPAGF